MISLKDRDQPFDASNRHGSVIAVARALCLLDAFGVGEPALTLTELSKRAGIHKTTALRLARTLASSNYMMQSEDGLWCLGPGAGALGARYQSTFDVGNEIEPTMRELVKQTRESASFYVREGDMRACIVGIEGLHPVSHNVRAGERLSLGKGAPGSVILAFSGATGELYERIRRRGYQISRGERDPEVSSVAAPVFGSNRRLLGALCVSGPSSRLVRPILEQHAKRLVCATHQLSDLLAGHCTSRM